MKADFYINIMIRSGKKEQGYHCRVIAKKKQFGVWSIKYIRSSNRPCIWVEYYERCDRLKIWIENQLWQDSHATSDQD